VIRARGFSLVELMVAITLALIVTAGVISVFIGSRSAYNSTSGTAALTDGGRFALNFIADSVRGAGNMACMKASGLAATLNNTGTPLTSASSFSKALGGYEAKNPANAYTITPPPVTADGNNADWIGGLDAQLNGQVVQNNDVLVVRSTLGNAVPAYISAIADGTAQFTVISPPGSLKAGQIAVISDCTKGEIFQITALGGGATPTVTHNGGAGTPGNQNSAFQLSYSNGSLVTPVDTLVYYIGRGADGDGALFLYSSNALGTWNSTELVPDIEAMQVLYGLDTAGKQLVTAYVTADQVTDFNAVMSVRIALLAASPPGAGRPAAAAPYNLLGTTVTPPVDTRSRQMFQETIAVRNSLN
jgi:type IV pilus assembly protein PilW